MSSAPPGGPPALRPDRAEAGAVGVLAVAGLVAALLGSAWWWPLLVAAAALLVVSTLLPLLRWRLLGRRARERGAPGG